jgi:RNA polymerase sigma-70 factor (ECF subfamily)
VAEALTVAGVVTDHGDGFDVAFPDLYRGALRLAGRMLGDRAAAEDVAAEAMARAFARWRTVRDLAHRDAWVLRVAANLALDALRRQGSRDRAVTRLRGDPLLDESLDAAATRLALGAALRELPERQRDAIVLRYLVGLPDDEVAAALGIAGSTVRTHVQLGLATLRRRLGTDPEEVGLAAD